MKRYIHEQNLSHYRKVLAETTDQAKRQTVLKLLANELASVWPPTVQLGARFEADLTSQMTP